MGIDFMPIGAGGLGSAIPSPNVKNMGATKRRTDFKHKNTNKKGDMIARTTGFVGCGKRDVTKARKNEIIASLEIVAYVPRCREPPLICVPCVTRNSDVGNGDVSIQSTSHFADAAGEKSLAGETVGLELGVLVGTWDVIFQIMPALGLTKLDLHSYSSHSELGHRSHQGQRNHPSCRSPACLKGRSRRQS